MSHKLTSSLESVLKIEFSVDELCDIIIPQSHQQDNASTIVDDCLDQTLFLSNNTTSGYIGELLALRSLEAHLAGHDVAVQWLNADEEQGHPYDITIQYPSNRLQKCEVKSHISHVRAPKPPSSQWFMSPHEVGAASTFEENYFCVFISAVLDDEEGVLVPRQCTAQIVGFERGLMDAIRAKDVSLVVQLNSTTVAPSGKEASKTDGGVEA